MHRFLLGLWCLGLVGVASQLGLAAEPIARVLPPAGIELPTERRQAIEQRLREVLGRAQPFLEHATFADAAVCIKAVDFALRHNEFYQAKDVDKALRILQLAEERLGQLSQQTPPWTQQHGRVVRGYRSRLDDSFQPYGLVISEDIDFQQPVPLYVWLHGRGDKQTDLHFLHERLDQDGQIKPDGAIVLHPFGRHCLGFKSAGEVDVIEAIEHVQSHYRIDSDRIVLIGFSMGGAGAWHLGAHYTDRFVAISPGAGFAETARYTNLKSAEFPPQYEQTLWGIYDVPNYTRNLFNRPVIAYSGEMDKQIQAAQIMEEAFQQHGKMLTHLIGPGMGHQYHPDTLRDLLKRLAAAVDQGRPKLANQVSLQTRTLRYNRMDWVEVLGLDEHWLDTRIDTEIVGERQLRVTTKNVTSLKLSPWKQMAGVEIEIDGMQLKGPEAAGSSVTLLRSDKWQAVADEPRSTGLRKRPGLQGPIDDVFLEPFLVVIPTGKSRFESVNQWIDGELQHFRDRWRATFRGELRVKPDREVKPSDIAQYHLVVWGTPESNSILKQIVSQSSESLPIRWSDRAVVAGKERFAAEKHIPMLIYPNPLNPKRYVVLNSGPTFREAHDRTNSLQNPKLPDWAIVDVTEPASARSPGRVAAAGFFNERWQLTAD